jgi:hypothetical protein
MRGEFPLAVSQLDGALALSDATTRPEEWVALRVLKAEFLHLECRDEEAFGLLDETLRKAPPGTSAETLFVLRNNRRDVAFEIFHADSLNDHDRLGDEERLAQFDLFDARQILVAEQAAAAGKHYDALPAFWREFVRAYYGGCWWPFRWVAKWSAPRKLVQGIW